MYLFIVCVYLCALSITMLMLTFHYIFACLTVCLHGYNWIWIYWLCVFLSLSINVLACGSVHLSICVFSVFVNGGLRLCHLQIRRLDKVLVILNWVTVLRLTMNTPSVGLLFFEIQNYAHCISELKLQTAVCQIIEKTCVLTDALLRYFFTGPSPKSVSFGFFTESMLS